MRSIGEFELIEKYFNRAISDPDVLLGIGDDAAIVSVSEPLAVATDTLVAHTHFPPALAAADIGYRALAINLSDMAAMGARPRWFTLALAIEAAEPDWLHEFATGLLTYADQQAVVLIGGDTTRGPLSITVHVLGELPGGRALRRSGASRGDDVYVTGTLGDAAAGLSLLLEQDTLKDSASRALARRFARPDARVAEGIALREIATAAIDISDGLLADLGHICSASGCGAEIDVDRLPLSEPLRQRFSRSDAEGFALGGGDDYELCFTARRRDAGRVTAALESCGGSICRIGRIVDGSDVRCLRAGRRVTPVRAGYEHF
jgi:thiamine-monophosphate kinase